MSTKTILLVAGIALAAAAIASRVPMIGAVVFGRSATVSNPSGPVTVAELVPTELGVPA